MIFKVYRIIIKIEPFILKLFLDLQIIPEDILE